MLPVLAAVATSLRTSVSSWRKASWIIRSVEGGRRWAGGGCGEGDHGEDPGGVGLVLPPARVGLDQPVEDLVALGVP